MRASSCSSNSNFLITGTFSGMLHYDRSPRLLARGFRRGRLDPVSVSSRNSAASSMRRPLQSKLYSFLAMAEVAAVETAVASLVNRDFNFRAIEGQNTPTARPAAAAKTVCILVS